MIKIINRGKFQIQKKVLTGTCSSLLPMCTTTASRFADKSENAGGKVKD